MVGYPCSPRDSQESSPTPQFKSINSSELSFLYSPALTSYTTTGKTIALTKWTFDGELMSLLSNMLSRLVIAFLPRSKRLYGKYTINFCSINELLSCRVYPVFLCSLSSYAHFIPKFLVWIKVHVFCLCLYLVFPVHGKHILG